MHMYIHDRSKRSQKNNVPYILISHVDRSISYDSCFTSELMTGKDLVNIYEDLEDYYSADESDRMDLIEAILTLNSLSRKEVEVDYNELPQLVKDANSVLNYYGKQRVEFDRRVYFGIVESLLSLSQRKTIRFQTVDISWLDLNQFI